MKLTRLPAGAANEQPRVIARAKPKSRSIPGIDDRLRDSIASSRTVEGIIELLRLEVSSRAFWRLVERKIEAKVGTQLNNVDRICVRLFQMDGKALGGGE